MLFSAPAAPCHGGDSKSAAPVNRAGKRKPPAPTGTRGNGHNQKAAPGKDAAKTQTRIGASKTRHGASSTRRCASGNAAKPPQTRRCAFTSYDYFGTGFPGFPTRLFATAIPTASCAAVATENKASFIVKQQRRGMCVLCSVRINAHQRVRFGIRFQSFAGMLAPSNEYGASP